MQPCPVPLWCGFGINPIGHRYRTPLLMADHVIPHFHNDAGIPVIEIGAHKFKCVGARPPFDHPHIYCDMGDSDEFICPYCSTLYRFDAKLRPAEARPASCALNDAGSIEPEVV